MAQFFMRNPLASANPLSKLTAKKSNVIVEFPVSDAETYLTHNVSFRVYKTQRENRNSNEQKEFMARITLPMPMQLSVGYRADYANPEIGAFGNLAAGAVDKIAQGIRSAGEAAESGITSEKIKNALTSVLSRDNAAALASATASGALETVNSLGAIGQGAAVGIQRTSGIARNPHKAVLYEGVDFRTHSFNFRLSPVSEKDSIAIQKIIQLFKWHMSPGFAAGVDVLGTNVGGGEGGITNNGDFFTVPDTFIIEFSNSKALFETTPCVLRNFSVDYQPQNYPAYVTADGENVYPMEVVISLEFQEIDIVTRKILDNPYQDLQNQQKEFGSNSSSLSQSITV